MTNSLTRSDKVHEAKQTAVRKERLRPHGCLALVAIALFSGCAVLTPPSSDRFSLQRQDQLAMHVAAAGQAFFAMNDQFAVSLDVFARFTEDHETPLRQRYEDLSREFTRSETIAGEMAQAVDQMEAAARVHFVDWENRLYEYSDPVIRNASRRQLDATRQAYEDVVINVRRLQGRTERVVEAFKDQVRFLSHNLNQQSLEALRNPAVELQLEMQDLNGELATAAETLDQLAFSFRVE